MPVPARGRQGAPSDVVNAEVMHRFEEETVVPALGAPPGAAGPEYLQHRRPILLCHPRQHGRLLPNRPAKCHRSTNVGIHSPHTQPNPSTRPNSADMSEGDGKGGVFSRRLSIGGLSRSPSPTSAVSADVVWMKSV